MTIKIPRKFDPIITGDFKTADEAFEIMIEECGKTYGLDDNVKKELEDAKLIYAYRSNGGYDDHIDIIWIKDRKMWHLTASHCSCNGFEGSWDECRDEVTPQSLLLDKNIDASLKVLIEKFLP